MQIAPFFFDFATQHTGQLPVFTQQPVVQRPMFVKERFDLIGMLATVETLGEGVGVVCFDQLCHISKIRWSHAVDRHMPVGPFS
ncbi:MAG: hypothetical protein NTV69_13575 [Caldilinea sp.]|jgi:hypothetical protein|nr:hypothetical protein [Caldilinea sp.]